MAEDSSLVFEQLPKVGPYYLRAISTLSGTLSRGETIPRITASVHDLSVRMDNLARYRAVCGFAPAARLPLTYPHVLAFPLHMAVLTHRAFPLKLLGLVHVRNEITQHRAIGTDERLNLSISVDGHRETAKGIEFDLETRVQVENETVWQGTSTMLSRQKTSVPGEESGTKTAPTLGFEPDEQATWSLPGDLGRRYAAAAGDYNPIHLSRWTARLFGFQRAIIHGMWSKARVASALSEAIDSYPCTMAVSFKKPIFLPGDVMFHHAAVEAGAERAFALTDQSNNIHHMVGRLTFTS